MLSIRHRPEAITPALLALIRPWVRYDADGRSCCWLTDGGLTLSAPPELAAVARAVCPEFDALKYGVALQGYRDGAAVTPCHSDLGSSGFILSIGATRTFRVHRVLGDVCTNIDEIRIECVHGTAVLMDKAFHAAWHHQIVADPGVTGERLSLVFRR